ncbi:MULTISPECIES: hypothetical protein [unclassified Bacillus (in: firmicutes)]|uniref:hypothetical protein n=1 Tax=unclassified Bacillus (in: firmicutes) TaxID=185979 RepID=UPI0013EE5BE0|nr:MULTISPECIES: hypothetical protein [unclassified Bacillus (in: firmicutes)]KAF6603771.1 hypothetical protein G9F48_01625 [Bacillus sp. EKM420B]KAF6608599.1 hypothetical protein G9F49_01610 [Bacillus sp. EKM417B]WGD67070.1 hypothetical protein P5646_18450 [Bacillus velezensis]
MLKMITGWYKYYDDNDPKLNHIEDGWSKDEYPQPIKPSFANQEAWRKSEWDRKYVYLDEKSRVIDAAKAIWLK